MKSKQFYFVLLLIVMLGGALRFYKFNAPIADWHSWRQVDTAAVARNFVDLDFDPLRPRYDDLSNIQSRKDNPQGYRMVEFPVYQILGYSLFRIFPQLTIEQSLRLISILSSILTLVLVGLIGRRLGGVSVGLWSAGIYAVLPYSFFYGRTILPEPFMIAMSLTAMWCMVMAKERKNIQSTLLLIMCSGFFSGVALLAKPYAIFLLLPILVLFLQIVIKQLTNFHRMMTMGISFVSLFIALAPFILWRYWILQFPEGIPSSTWLLNEGNIRLKGAWFYWLFAERIAKLILGYWGVGFVLLGFLKQVVKRDGIVFGWSFGLFAYMFVIARGNVQHDYYQQLLLPLLSVLSGLGIASLFYQQKIFSLLKRAMLVSIVLLFSVAFSWYDVRGYFWINRPEIIEAGKAADELLPKQAKVIAPYGGDTTFLYQTKRQGWPIGFDIQTKIVQGATHYVTVSPNDSDAETASLSAMYKVLVRNDRYAIIDLTHKNPAE